MIRHQTAGPARKMQYSNKSRLVSEDIWTVLAFMRFLLAIWVLFAHTLNFGPAARAMPVPSSNALVAVYCFLAISGFSIHHSIAQRPEGYGMRRFWRIAPTHVVSVVLALLAYYSFGPVLFDGRNNPWPLPPLGGWVAAAILLQALLPIARLAVLFPSWSLSLECIYYAFGPLLRRSSTRFAVVLVLASCAFCLARPSFSKLYIGSDTYGISAVALLWAWVGGWLLYSGEDRLRCFLLVSIVGSVCIFRDKLLSGAFNHVAWWLTTSVCCFGTGRFLNPILRRTGQYLGELSYPLYLIHYPVLFLLFNGILKNRPELNYGMLHVAVSLTAAVLCYHLVDFPVRHKMAEYARRARA
jgi:peptidoglycan/LPS O-acetylase OafA/YrhL